MYMQYLSCLLSINEVKYYGMDKKKILLTILIAGILAFISAFIFLRTDKPVQQEAIKQEIAEPKIEQPQEEKAEEKVEKTSQNISESKKITPHKQIKKTKVSNKKKPAAVTPLETEPLPKLEVKIEENKQEEINPRDFTVPVQYTSQNTYKYVYTPARYSK